MSAQHVRELLPFFINGTLSELENARVSRHLAGCASCHDDLGEQHQLRDLMRAAPEPPADPSLAWARLARTLDEESRARLQSHRIQSRRVRSRWMRPAWMSVFGFAAAAALVLLLVPTVLVDPRSGVADYRTLTSAAPDAAADSGAIRVVFVSQATVGDIEDLLDRTGLQIASGPTPRGVYTLAPDANASVRRDALATLRASPLVALAAPAGGVADGR